MKLNIEFKIKDEPMKLTIDTDSENEDQSKSFSDIFGLLRLGIIGEIKVSNPKWELRNEIS